MRRFLLLLVALPLVIAATMSSETLPRLMTVEEAAEYLGLSRNNLYIAAGEGRIPSFKVGSLVRFDLAELRAWLDSNRRGPKRAEK